MADGDTNFYNGDPFVYKKKVEKKGIFDSIRDGAFQDQGDHAEILGFNLLRFDDFEKKLDPINGQGFNGFTPRWTLPTKIRNTTNPNLNTSCMMVILDSKREV